MRHHIWYVDYIRALQEAAEALLAARYLAEEADGTDSDSYVAMGNAFGLATTNLELAVLQFVKECCSCEESSRETPGGQICDAHRLEESLRLSNQYKRGDIIVWKTHQTEGATTPANGRITNIRVEPSGATIIRAHIKYLKQTVELTWRDIELAPPRRA